MGRGPSSSIVVSKPRGTGALELSKMGLESLVYVEVGRGDEFKPVVAGTDGNGGVARLGEGSESGGRTGGGVGRCLDGLWRRGWIFASKMLDRSIDIRKSSSPVVRVLKPATDSSI